MVELEGGKEMAHTDGLEMTGGIDYHAPDVRPFPLRIFLNHHDRCSKCPQYGERIIYERKCYYQRMCYWPVFIQIWRLKRILKRRTSNES
jgi:hypothetical protein